MYSVGGGVLSVFTRTIFQSVFFLLHSRSLSPAIRFCRSPAHVYFFFFRPAVSMTLALWLRPHCNLCRTASNSGVKKGHVSHWFIDWLVTYPKPEVSARVRLCTFLYTASVWSLSTKSNPVLSSPFHTAPPFVRGQLLGTAPCFSARERQIVMESAQGRDLWGGRL